MQHYKREINLYIRNEYAVLVTDLS